MVKMKALGKFLFDGVGPVETGQEFECDSARADYLHGIGLAVKMNVAPKNKMDRAPKNKGNRNAD